MVSQKKIMVAIAVIGIIIYNYYKKDRNYKMIGIIKIIVALFAEPDFRYTNFFNLTEPDFRFTNFFDPAHTGPRAKDRILRIKGTH